MEDDEQLGRVVTAQLGEAGLATTSVTTVRGALRALADDEPDVVLLDLGLPDGSGIEVLQALQSQRSAAHVIVLSGAGAEVDRIGALEAGADDYLVKPFSVREVVARIAAVSRRRAPTLGHLVHGPLDIDVEARRVLHRGEPIDLTPKEFDLLLFLASRPGQVFARAELLRSVWDSSPEWQQEKTVTEHVRRLRAKLEPEAADPRVLVTVRGRGYRFDPPVSPG